MHVITKLIACNTMFEVLIEVKFSRKYSCNLVGVRHVRTQ